MRNAEWDQRERVLMEQKTGKTISNGIAVGKIKFQVRAKERVVGTHIEDTAAELARYDTAKKKAVEQLHTLYEKALRSVGNENAEIFGIHAMLLEDDDYNKSVENIIKTQGINAEYAVTSTGNYFAGIFANMDDEYFKARSADIKDITERVVTILCNDNDDNDFGDEPVIIVADDLVPSETVQIDKGKLLAFVTHLGSAYSHTAILARTMGIPALAGVDIDEQWNGRIGVVDGYEGKFLVDPDKETLEDCFKKKANIDKQKQLLQTLIGKENVTKSGQKINLYANIGNPDDLASVLANDAGGIGLFRSEFLFFKSEAYPTEEEQFLAYKKVLETMDGRKVVIRTLDIGADKQTAYFNLDKEDNPALGCRAIRICLSRPEIFRTQLRALYRASAYGNLAIMYPMIISVNEVRRVKEISKSVREELIAEGIKIGDVEEGIMIETPAAAIMSDQLAKEVDFFSIGTNDLTQYTLAIDSQNAKLDLFYDAHHPAVLRLIQMVTENAHKAGIRSGICGELGADTELTGTFLKYGVDELSVSPGCILPLRKVIRDAE